LSLTAEAAVDIVVSEHLQKLDKLSAMCCKTSNNGSVARSTCWPTPCYQKCDAERKYPYLQSHWCSNATTKSIYFTAKLVITKSVTDGYRTFSPELRPTEAGRLCRVGSLITKFSRAFARENSLFLLYNLRIQLTKSAPSSRSRPPGGGAMASGKACARARRFKSISARAYRIVVSSPA
jgi:hypothetical protein